jgi:hypothetical protein
MHRDLALRKKAVAEGLRSADQPERRHRQRLVAEQRDQAMRGPHELHRCRAVFELVAHHLRDRQLLQRFVEDRLHGGDQRRTLAHALVEQHVLLAVVLALQQLVIGVDAERGELLQQRLRGIAERVEPDRRRHQLLPERLVGRALQHVRDVDREPARRTVRGSRAVGRQQMVRAQTAFDAGRERLGQRLQRLRRQFLGMQLDQKGSLHQAASRRAASSIGKPSRSRAS